MKIYKTALKKDMALYDSSCEYLITKSAIYATLAGDINNIEMGILLKFNNVSRYELEPSTESYYNARTYYEDKIEFPRDAEGLAIVNIVSDPDGEYYAINNLEIGILKVWAESFQEDFSLRNMMIDTTMHKNSFLRYAHIDSVTFVEYFFATFSIKLDKRLFIKFISAEFVEDEFCGEVKDSEWLKHIIKTNLSKYLLQNLHHFRICMNNFGYLDIIAKDMIINK